MKKFLCTLVVLVIGIALGLYLSGNPNMISDVVAKFKTINQEQTAHASNQSLASTNSKNPAQTVKQSFSTPEPEKNSAAQGLRPDFKKAMDDYEAFYNQYCDLLKKVNENPLDFSLLQDYSSFLLKADEVDKSFEAWDDSEMTTAEIAYYLDVQNRVMKRCLEFAD